MFIENPLRWMMLCQLLFCVPEELRLKLYKACERHSFNNVVDNYKNLYSNTDIPNRELLVNFLDNVGVFAYELGEDQELGLSEAELWDITKKLNEVFEKPNISQIKKAMREWILNHIPD